MNRILQLSSSVTARILAVRLRALAILLLGCAAAAWGLTGLSLSESMQGYVDEQDDEVLYFRDQQQIFGDFEAIFILVEGDEAIAADVADRGQSLYAQIERHPLVIQVLGSDDGPLDGFSDRRVFDPGVDQLGMHTYWVIAALDRAETGMQARMSVAADIRAYAADFAGDGVRIHISGLPAVALDALEQTRADFVAFLWLIPLAFGLVLVGFYRLRRCILVPPIVIGVAVTAATGLFAGSGHAFDMISIAFPVVISVIVFADLIHVLHRYHVEADAVRGRARATGAADTPDMRRDVIVRTMQSMNIACFMTSITTAAGFIALTLSPIPAIATFALWTAGSIMLAWVIVVILTPILLSFMSLPSERELQHYFSGGVLRGLRHVPAVARHPAVPVGFLALLLIAGLGMRHLQVESDMRTFLPDELPSMVAAERMAGSLMGGDRVSMVVHGSPGEFAQIDAMRRLDQLQQDVAAAHPQIDGTFSIVDVLRGLETTGALPSHSPGLEEMLFRLEFAVDERWLDGLLSQDRAHALVELRLPGQGRVEINRLLADMDEWLAANSPEGWQARTTGPLKLYAIHEGVLVESLISSLVLTLVMIGFVLLAFFRSVRLVVIALVANVLPVAFTLGAMGLIGIGLNTTTMMMASIVVALAVDNTIHILAAYREARSHGVEPDAAVTRAVNVSGYAVLVSSAVLVAGFAVLAFAGLTPMRNFGLMMCFAALTALVVDLLLLLHMVRRWGEPGYGNRGVVSG